MPFDGRTASTLCFLYMQEKMLPLNLKVVAEAGLYEAKKNVASS